LSRFLWIAVGAALGANARYMIGLWAGDKLGVVFPFGTTIVNITGALMLGFVLELSTDRLLTSPEARLLVATGFLGSYTTFSTYMVESVNLMRQGSLFLGVVNVAGEAALGLVFAMLGIFLARTLGM
jgi:CrcB protein